MCVIMKCQGLVKHRLQICRPFLHNHVQDDHACGGRAGGQPPVRVQLPAGLGQLPGLRLGRRPLPPRQQEEEAPGQRPGQLQQPAAGYRGQDVKMYIIMTRAGNEGS